MNVVSYCALRASLLPWQPRPNAHALTVICKATFDLRPGESPLATTQEPIRDASALVSDLVPFKRRADILVVGRAYPPNASTTSVVARICMGTWQKTVEARADRQWIVAGAAPIPPTAPSRMAFLGRHAATWDHRAWNLKPLPQDVDGAFFNAAPVDQQLVELSADEPLLLEHLHPHHRIIETKLTRVSPHVLVQPTNGPVQDVRMRCDTLTIDTDKRIAMVVWRGVALLSRNDENGVVTVTAETDSKTDIDSTLMLTAPIANTIRGPALPFVQDKPNTADPIVLDAETRRPERTEDDATGTMMLWYAGVATTVKPVTPFEAQARPPATMTEQDQATAEAPTNPSPMPFDVPTPALVLASIASLPTEPVVEKPPMLGPLVTIEAPFKSTTSAEPNATDALASANQSLADEPSVAPIEEPEPASLTLTLEQVATIAAELAEGQKDRTKILEMHGLRERSWRKNEARWNETIEAQSARGAHALRTAYDATYVAKVEEFRGPIQLPEYARLVVALERGQVNEALDALKIHRPALMPVVRLWTRKVAKDMKLGDAANDVLRNLRRA